MTRTSILGIAALAASMARGSLAALVLAGAAVTAGPADADILKLADALRGITMTQAQCAAIQQTLWLNVYGRDFCVRYYLSTAGGQGSRPVVFLNGDSIGSITISKSGFSWATTSDGFNTDTDGFMAEADRFSEITHTTAIYIGRIGVEGTSGNHLDRKTLLELALMNAALDALKQRYGFEGFHLAGQSGGSLLAFGLLPLRHDIGCAVSGSGPLAASPNRRAWVPGDPARTYFELDMPALAHNHAVRQMMVTDPADQQVPAATGQTPMAVQLRQAGGLVEQYFVLSSVANHHDVLEYTRLVMAGCLLGRPQSDIVNAASTIGRRNALASQIAEDKARFKAQAMTQAMTQAPSVH
jgi:hypothetical protein